MKKLSLLLACILSASGLFAQHVTEEQALQKAQAFMQGKVINNVNGRKGVSTKPRAMKRVAQPTQKQGEDALYLFNVEDNGGFVIVSGDERTEAILGYSTEGHIDPYTMPQGVRALLKHYKDQLSAIPDGETLSSNTLTKHPYIAPLTQNAWAQVAPYNIQCPEIGGQHCVAGCIAIAMAQVMYYYQWPKSSVPALPAYDYGIYGNTIDVEGLPSTTFDWNAIPANWYDTSWEEEHAENMERAKLIRYCGQAVRMQYGLDESVSYPQYIHAAMVRNFDYDNSCRFVEHTDYSIKEWDELIYSELQAGRPVIYSGHAEDFLIWAGGGHTWICEGYDGDGLYFCNFGWGAYNGFYRLDLFDFPSGFGSPMILTYARNQNAVIGIQPSVEEQNIELSIRASVAVNESSELALTFDNSYCLNDQTADIGLGYLDATGTIHVISSLEGISFEAYVVGAEGPAQKTITAPAASVMSGMANGTYQLIPVFKKSSTTDWQTTIDKSKVVVATIKNGVVSVAEHMVENDTEIEIVMTQKEHEGYALEGRKTCFDIKIYNRGDHDFYGYCQNQDIKVDEPDMEIIGIPCYIHIAPNDSLTFETEPSFEKSGKYIYTLYVGATAKAEKEVLVLPVGAELVIQNPDFGEPEAIRFGKETKLSVRVKNISKDTAYDGPVIAQLKRNDDLKYKGLGTFQTDPYVTTFRSDNIHIAPGEETDVDISIAGWLPSNEITWVNVLQYAVNTDILTGLINDEDNPSYKAHPIIPYIYGEYLLSQEPYNSCTTYIKIWDENNKYASLEIQNDRNTILDHYEYPSVVKHPETGEIYTILEYRDGYFGNDTARVAEGVSFASFPEYEYHPVVEIPSSVIWTSINKPSEKVLHSILLHPASPPQITGLFADDLANLYYRGDYTRKQEILDNVVLYVPIGCGGQYKAHEVWGAFKNIVETDFTKSDYTAYVGVTAEDWHAGGMVGWAGPQVTTRDGRETALAERYAETTEVTGTVLEQTVTGLSVGVYEVTLFANAFYTPDRGFDSDITEGQTDVVYLFANETKKYIPAHIGTIVAEHGEYTLACNVTDGSLHLGMTAAREGTNWHSIQIKSLDRTGNVKTGNKGDVNGDGAVDVADIASVISVMAGSIAIAYSAADVNGDGSVDVADIATIISIMAGGAGEQVTYYWYAGQTQPSSMSSDPTVDDTNFTNNKWHTLGSTGSTSTTISKTVTGGTSGCYWYIAAPSGFIATASDLSTPDTSMTQLSNIIVNGNSYVVYRSNTTSVKFSVYMKKKDQ